MKIYTKVNGIYLTSLKVDVKMKLTLFFFILTLFNMQAHTTYGQKTKISLDLTNVTIQKSLDEIESMTDFKFFINIEEVNVDEKISIVERNKAIDNILKKIFKNQDVDIKILGKQIVIGSRKENLLRLEPENTSQSTTVTGAVTDIDGSPLPGASVVVKGTSNGTQSDFDGNFAIEGVNENDILIVSYIGFATQEIAVENRTEITIVLEESAAGLDEVIVVGYGSQRKADLTGSVVRIDPQKTADLPNSNILQSIQGLVPGININAFPGPGDDNNDAGTVGDEPQIRVRGDNSLSAGNNPLIVVDNVIYNGSITDFSSSDIASIDILKDASATAVYGARAANGVFLITTKRGVIGKPRFNFNTYTGIQRPEKLIPVLDGPKYEQKIADFNEAVPSANVELTPNEILNKNNGSEIDWVDRSLRSAVITNYHLDVSGASENTNYYISGTYFDQEGIVKGDQFNRLTLNLNLKNKLTDWWSIGVRSTFVSADRSGKEADIDQAYRQSPYGDFFDEEGPGGLARFPFGDALGAHPLLNTLINNESSSTSLRGVFSSEINFPFVDGLKWTVNYGANLRDGTQNEFTLPGITSDSETANGIAKKDRTRNFDWTLDNIINYDKQFNEKHNVGVTFLLSRESRRLDETKARANDFVSQELQFNNLELGAIQSVKSKREEQNTLSQMGRLNYGFDSRYSLTYTIRRDGFSAFSPNKKFGVFQAGAFAWTISNEKFLENSNFLPYLKLRLSYGQNGNQAIPRFSSFSRLNTNQYLFGNGGSSIATYGFESLANANLTWETTTSFNFGLDFSITNDSRISGSVDVYNSRTEDLLQSRSIPTISGFTSILTNIGEVKTNGIDLSLSSINVDADNFKWESTAVFSISKNEIVTLGGVDADGDGREDDDISNEWFIGQPIDAIFGFKTDGIWQLSDETAGNIPEGFRAGDFKLSDENGDGVITPDDRTILGRSLPDYTLSFGNTFRYKGFSLYVLVNSAFGKNYVGDNFATRSVNKRGFTSFSERFNVQDVPYWTASNPTDLYPRIDYSPSFGHPILESRDFIRFQDISLSYTFNERVLEIIGIQNLKMFLSAKNIATITDWSGYDPQSGTTIENLPLLSSYTFGMNFNF